jgi:hypothetical protein
MVQCSEQDSDTANLAAGNLTRRFTQMRWFVPILVQITSRGKKIITAVGLWTPIRLAAVLLSALRPVRISHRSWLPVDRTPRASAITTSHLAVLGTSDDRRGGRHGEGHESPCRWLILVLTDNHPSLKFVVLTVDLYKLRPLRAPLGYPQANTPSIALNRSPELTDF